MRMRAKNLGKHAALAVMLALFSTLPATATAPHPMNMRTHASLVAQSPAPKRTPAPRKANRTAIKIPEPGSLILFGGAIILLLVARRFGRTRNKPMREDQWFAD